jgi:hypothetical protein
MPKVLAFVVLLLALIAAPATGTGPGQAGYRSSTCVSGNSTTVTSAAIDTRGSNFAFVAVASTMAGGPNPDDDGGFVVTDSLGNSYEFEYNLDNRFGTVPHYWSSYYQTPPFGSGHAPFPVVLTSAATTYTATSSNSAPIVMCVGTFSYVSVPPGSALSGGSKTGNNITGFTVSPVSTSDNGVAAISTFLWTDLSESPTVSAPFTIGAQQDWSSGAPLGMLLFYAIVPTAQTISGGITMSWGTTSTSQNILLSSNGFPPYTSTRFPPLFIAP